MKLVSTKPEFIVGTGDGDSFEVDGATIWYSVSRS